MAIVNQFPDIIKNILTEIYKQYQSYKDGTRHQLIIDSDTQNYLLLRDAWQNDNRYYGIIIHIEIKADGKVWVHEDNTELIVVDRLLERGISPKNMVIGWHPPSMREATEFAVA